MRYKEVKKLTEWEDKIRWQLQYQYNYKQNNLDDGFIQAEWNGMMLLANFVVDDNKTWGIHAGVVMLMEEIN